MTIFGATIRTILRKSLGISFRVIPHVRRAMKSGLTVFVFHEVTDQPSQFSKEYELAVSTQTFKRQMSWIQNNFKIIHPLDIFCDTPLPKRVAIISFDDGFLSTFQNGLPILEKMGVPAIAFLNMQAILEQMPILSAIACYLNRNVPEFSDFMKSVGIPSPFHITLNPSMLNSFEKHSGPIDMDAVLAYQGRFADLHTLESWNDKSMVVYGNHLFDHWNASALSTEQFEDQYKKNEIALSKLKNSVNLFSFTNGRFSWREISLLTLKELGAERIFSSAGCLNGDSNTYLIDRISLNADDIDPYHFWFKIGLGLVRKHLRENYFRQLCGLWPYPKNF